MVAMNAQSFNVARRLTEQNEPDMMRKSMLWNDVVLKLQ